MKRTIFNLILTIIMLSSTAFASDNSLNAVFLEGTDSGYNVILRTDRVTNIKKTVQADGTLLLDLKNISTSENLDTRYINTKNVNNMVVENAGENSVKIYIQAEDIEKADIIFDTPAAPPIVVSDGLTKKEIGWIAVIFLAVLAISGSFKRTVEIEEKIALKKDMTEREIKLYKEFKSDILTSAKIDYRLKQHIAEKGMSNTIKRADTIRNLQKMSCR